MPRSAKQNEAEKAKTTNAAKKEERCDGILAQGRNPCEGQLDIPVL